MPRPRETSVLVGRLLAKKESERDGWLRNKAGMGWGGERASLGTWGGGVGMGLTPTGGARTGGLQLGGDGGGEQDQNCFLGGWIGEGLALEAAASTQKPVKSPSR